MNPLRHRLEGVVFVFYKLEKGQKKGDVLKLKRFRHKKKRQPLGQPLKTERIENSFIKNKSIEITLGGMSLFPYLLY